MIRRFLAVALTVIALVAVAVHHTIARGASGTTLHLYVSGDPHSLDPLLAQDSDDVDATSLVMEPLFAYDSRVRPHAVLATEIPTTANHGISPDGRTFTVHLRRGVRWQDGSPFTSRDVAFTIRTILDPKNVVPNRSLYTGIQRVETPDASTVVFHLAAPNAYFLSDVISGYPIVPAHRLEHSRDLLRDPFNAAPVGTGPYRLDHWQRGEELVFVPNPTYRDGPPIFDRIVVEVKPDLNTVQIALRDRELDFGAVESAQYNALRDAPVLRRIEPNNDFVGLGLNQDRALMRDPAVKGALAKAIDKRRIVQTVTFGTGIVAYGDLPDYIYAGRLPAGFDRADPAGARALLERDGWKVGPDGIRVKNGVPLRLQYIDYSGSPSGATIDVQLIQMWRDVGIDVQLKTFVPQLYFASAADGGPQATGAFDIAALAETGAASSNDAQIYTCASREPTGLNIPRYCSAQMDRLQATAMRTFDVAQRNRIVAQIEDLAVHDGAYIFLYHTPYRIIERPDLRRPVASITNLWYQIQRWSFTAR